MPFFCIEHDDHLRAPCPDTARPSAVARGGRTPSARPRRTGGPGEASTGCCSDRVDQQLPALAVHGQDRDPDLVWGQGRDRLLAQRPPRPVVIRVGLLQQPGRPPLVGHAVPREQDPAPVEARVDQQPPGHRPVRRALQLGPRAPGTAPRCVLDALLPQRVSSRPAPSTRAAPGLVSVHRICAVVC